MQLRSGKITNNTISADSSRICDDRRFYGKCHRENITMTMEDTSQGKSNTLLPEVVRHSMSLRSSRTVGNPPDPMHFADMVTAQYRDQVIIDSNTVFRNWLLHRLKRLISEIKSVEYPNHNVCSFEKLRICSEMIDVLYEHIDYITSSPELMNFSSTVYTKMNVLIKELTGMLNKQQVNGYVYKFTRKQRRFIGNLRSDMVKLMVITGNRIS